MANPRVDDLRKRLERDPGSRLFAQLAEELRKDGALLEAIQVCREGLRKHPGYPSARLTLGRCLADSGDPRAAAEELSAVFTASPDNLLAGRLLAESQEALGDCGRALATSRQLVRLAPGDKPLRERLMDLEERAARNVARASQPSGAGGDLAPIPLVPVDDDAFELERPVQAGGFSQPRAAASVPLQTAPPGEPSPEPPLAEEVFEFESGVGSASGEPVFRSLEADADAATEALAAPPMPATVPGIMLTDLAGPALASATLAELYQQQGETLRAVWTYREVLKREPGNTKVRERLDALQALLPVAAGASRREVIVRTIARLEALRSAMAHRG